MTIDEGIKNLEYGTKQLEMELESDLWIKGSESELSCKEGIAHNKQHIEWLRELKEAKRLLKAAVEDFSNIYDHILDCDGMCGTCPIHGKKDNCPMWHYADEALRLIES